MYDASVRWIIENYIATGQKYCPWTKKLRRWKLIIIYNLYFEKPNDGYLNIVMVMMVNDGQPIFWKHSNLPSLQTFSQTLFPPLKVNSTKKWPEEVLPSNETFEMPSEILSEGAATATNSQTDDIDNNEIYLQWNLPKSGTEYHTSVYTDDERGKSHCS